MWWVGRADESNTMKSTINSSRWSGDIQVGWGVGEVKGVEGVEEVRSPPASDWQRAPKISIFAGLGSQWFAGVFRREWRVAIEVWGLEFLIFSALLRLGNSPSYRR